MTAVPLRFDIDLVLPCLDEALALPWVLDRLPDGVRAIVVDNGSTDGSADVARALGAVVIRETQRGYGAAVLAGLAAARAEYVVVMDADATLDPAEITDMVDHLRSGRADLVCGRRRPVAAGVWPWHARLGNRMLAAMISAGAGSRLHDIAPVRATRRTDLLALEITDRRCGHPLQTLLFAARRGMRILEVDVSYRARALGTTSKISGTLRGTGRVVHDFARVLWDARSSATATIEPAPTIPTTERLAS